MWVSPSLLFLLLLADYSNYANGCSEKRTALSQRRWLFINKVHHAAPVTEGNVTATNVAGRDVHTGIDSKDALNTLVETSAKLGRSEKENEQLMQTIKQLEERLVKPSIQTSAVSEQSTPTPSAEAKELAKLITEDDWLYAQALKAIAGGNAKKADELLNGAQQFLSHVKRKKDEAQAKIYMARIQNTCYSSRPQHALQYCDKLKLLAGNDSLILNEMARVYYENAEYKKAGPLMERALKIDEKSLGPEHPNVAMRLNNLAQLYQDTNRLKEAEPLMERTLVIWLQFTRRTDHRYPHWEAAIKNYTRLLTQMGHSKAEVAGRLKRLAPEMFK
jgi:tetratricopeptide (TPR) repeat protein